MSLSLVPSKCTRQILLAVLIALLAFIGSAAGETLPSQLAQAMCRITCRTGSASNLGSGTLVDVTSDRSQGLVLTCAHLFSDGVGEIVVDFPGVRSHGGRLIALDQKADLAAIVIAHPRVAAITLANPNATSSELVACGFGGEGRFQAIRGAVVGQANSPGQENILLRGAVRSGDSGGAALNEAGQLAAVVWGTTDGVTYATTGAPLVRFLSRMLPSQSVQTAACPNGMCPRQPMFSRPQIVQPLQPRTPPISNPQRDQLANRITQLEQTKQDCGDFALRSELAGFVSQETWQAFTHELNDRYASVLDQLNRLASGREAGTAVATTLGVSGPAGWAIVAASILGGTLLGHTWIGRRFRARGVGGRRDQPFRSAN